MSAPPESRSRGIDTDVSALRSLGTDRAFERMYRKHASDVYRYALAVVRHAGDAEDVTQTTFLNAYRALQRGERPLKAKSWLLAIAHNVCRQRFRNAARRPQQVAFDEDLAEAVVPEDSPSAEDLVRALQQLSFNQRSALVMRELEGRPYKEIGEILQLPVSAVETLLFRARRALREQLETDISCNEAEEMLSRQLDGRLPRGERGALRAHLRACEECAHLARSQRAQRSAWKSLAVIPLPGSLGSLFGGGGTVATGVAAKVAAVGVAAAIVGGGTYEGVRVVEARVQKEPAAGMVAAAPVAARRTAPLPRSVPTVSAVPSSAHQAGKSVALKEHAGRGKGLDKTHSKNEAGSRGLGAQAVSPTPSGHGHSGQAPSNGHTGTATHVTAVRPVRPTETTTKKKHKQATSKAHAGSVHATGGVARGKGATKQTGPTNASNPVKSAPQPKDSSNSAPSDAGNKH
jgi:RNA polymerase sigma-70 factor, ECF subfamily